MKAEVLIADSELCKRIKTTEAVNWVASLLKRFHGSENDKQCLILKQRPVKEIIDELIPLSKYAQHEYNDNDIYLQFYPGSKTSYDAEFIDNAGSVIERVEVTMAINGQQKKIQAEHLIKYGHTSIFDTPDYRGPVDNRELAEYESTVKSSDVIIEEQAVLLQQAYDNKQKQLHKYPNITLLIGLDVPLLMKSEYQQIIDKLKIKKITFNSIKCLSICGHHYTCLL